MNMAIILIQKVYIALLVWVQASNKSDRLWFYSHCHALLFMKELRMDL